MHIFPEPENPIMQKVICNAKVFEVINTNGDKLILMKRNLVIDIENIYTDSTEQYTFTLIFRSCQARENKVT